MAEPGGQVGRARVGRGIAATLAGGTHTAAARGCGRVGFKMWVTWPQHGMARRCALVRERRERWHGVCVPGLGADILPPAPRQCQYAAGWLEYQKPRSRIWYAYLTAPRNDSPPPLLRPLRRSLSARGFATCRPGSSCHLLRRFALVRVCAAFSQWSSVSREHPPRRLARQTSPAAAVTSPRIVLNYKKTAFCAVCVWFWGCFWRCY